MIDFKEAPTDAYEKAVFTYLKTRAETDECLRAACGKEKKTMKGVLAYVKSEARKQSHGAVAVLADETVYEMAVHYILEDSINFEDEGKAAEKREKRRDAAKKRVRAKEDGAEKKDSGGSGTEDCGAEEGKAEGDEAADGGSAEEAAEGAAVSGGAEPTEAAAKAADVKIGQMELF